MFMIPFHELEQMFSNIVCCYMQHHVVTCSIALYVYLDRQIMTQCRALLGDVNSKMFQM